MTKHKIRFFVGTSGWSYPHWKGVFYPEDWPKSKWFAYYTGEFPSVEVNATFYRTFKDQTYHNWRSRAPEGFVYVLKAPRLITHRKFLKDSEEQIKAFCKSAALLEDKLGLILLQLAPRTPYDPARLEQALRAFDDPAKVAVEFRNEQWLTEETKELLSKVGAVFCNVDSPQAELTDWVTSDSAYIRLHGRRRWYNYDYSARELQEIGLLAKRLAKLGARDVYIFFNNDADGCAPRNARLLLEMLRA